MSVIKMSRSSFTRQNAQSTLGKTSQCFKNYALASLLLVLVLQWDSISARADLIFTDRNAFEAGLPPGFFIDNFSSAQDAVGAPAPFYTNSGGTPTIQYTITAPPGGLFIGQLVNPPGAKLIGPWNDSDDLFIAFHTPNVFRVGMDIGVEGIEPVTRDVTIDLSSGASITFSLPAVQFSFVGVYSDVPLDWLNIRAVGNGLDLNTRLLTTAVPEPSTVLLVLLSSGMTLWRRQT